MIYFIDLIFSNYDIRKMNNFDCSKFENSAISDQKHYIDLNLKAFFVTGGYYCNYYYH